MSRNEIEDVLTLETSETVLRHRRSALQALLLGQSRSGKLVKPRHRRDGDERHERRRPVAHASMSGDRS